MFLNLKGSCAHLLLLKANVLKWEAKESGRSIDAKITSHILTCFAETSAKERKHA